jgi:hypothetical protein
MAELRGKTAAQLIEVLVFKLWRNVFSSTFSLRPLPQNCVLVPIMFLQILKLLSATDKFRLIDRATVNANDS